MTIFLYILLACAILRLEVLHPIDDTVLSIGGFFVLKLFFVTVYVSILSIYMTHLHYFLSDFIKRIFFVFFGVFVILLVSSSQIYKIYSDTLTFIISLFFLVGLFFSGDQFYSKMINVLHFKERGIEDAFLQYPPKGHMDIIFSYILVLIFFAMPLMVGNLWNNLIGK